MIIYGWVDPKTGVERICPRNVDASDHSGTPNWSAVIAAWTSLQFDRCLAMAAPTVRCLSLAWSPVFSGRQEWGQVSERAKDAPSDFMDLNERGATPVAHPSSAKGPARTFRG
jgi:hypothetical protein